MITQNLTPFNPTKKAIEGTGAFRENASYSWEWLINHTTEQNTIIDQFNQELANVYRNNVICATTTNLAATYLNNVLTFSAAGATTIDGIAIALNNRILVKNQTSVFQNGIYIVTTVGTASVATVLTRATDANTSTKISGSIVSVRNGTINGGTFYITSFKDSDVVGTTVMNWYRLLYETGSYNINAATATKLQTSRTINDIPFDGTLNIEIEDRLGAAIASAATITIGTSGIGEYIHITGTTTITSLGVASSAGIRRTLIFDSALTLTHNATSLICPAGSNIVTVAGTTIEVIAETTGNWRVVSVMHPSVDFSEYSYLNGATSNIQAQLNTKLGTNSQTFTASGTFTVPANVTRILVYAANAGGGGSGGGKGSTTGGDGGGGGASIFGAPRWINTTPGATFTVVIGAGGAGGAGATGEVVNSGYGGIGGLTSFGSYKFPGSQIQAQPVQSGTTIQGAPFAIGIGGGGGVSGLNDIGDSPSFLPGAAGLGGRDSVYSPFHPYTNSGGGLANSGGGGAGATGDGNNGSAGVASSGANGGAGGAGAAGKVIVYW